MRSPDSLRKVMSVLHNDDPVMTRTSTLSCSYQLGGLLIRGDPSIRNDISCIRSAALANTVLNVSRSPIYTSAVIRAARLGCTGSGGAQNAGPELTDSGGGQNTGGGEVEVTRPTVQNNPEAFDPPNGFTAQSDLSNSMGFTTAEVYCPNCLQFKLNHPVQPWSLETCTAPCGTCHKKHAPGFCPKRWCTYSHYREYPRQPYVSEGIKFMPNEAELQQFRDAGIDKFSRRRLQQETTESEQRAAQYAALSRAQKAKHEAEIAREKDETRRLRARIAELEEAIRRPLPPHNGADDVKEEDDDHSRVKVKEALIKERRCKKSQL
ncbi:hypothetical protein P171DRAFT_522545 [Karstenula rhodostoma CBS 690.94]|uniref:Uncharacterized protein n=1 Tax=Karstenula rhodostoma CBS 690.94 TaxID=1392251 RepID=A0A9P4UA56_9PLEO|nr:hypothetical protein P171DRAFT_522545 [Karstenula rhodostoma CBS 690.94]